MSTVDVDQSAIGTTDADVNALSLVIIYRHERPALSALKCERQPVALACAEGKPCAIVQFAGLNEMDDIVGPPEFHHT